MGAKPESMPPLKALVLVILGSRRTWGDFFSIFIDFTRGYVLSRGAGDVLPDALPGGRATYHQYLKHLHYYFHSLQYLLCLALLLTSNASA